MTKRQTPKSNFAQFAAQMARNPTTLAELHEAMFNAERLQEIGERLRQLRKERAMTQKQVAWRVPTDTRNLQNWEAGSHGTSADNYERLAEILGTSYDYIVSGETTAPPREDIITRLDKIEAGQAALLEALRRPAAEGAERGGATPRRARPSVKRTAKRSPKAQGR